MDKSYPLLSCNGLKKYYPIRRGMFKRVVGEKKIVEDVSLDIYSGQTVALVGESGCGKSVLMRVLLDLEKPTDGVLRFKGCRYKDMNAADRKDFRNSIQMIFQDTAGALHPRMTVYQSLEEALILSGVKDKNERRQKILETLKTVGLDEMYADRYPQSLSGGQRQRVVIARALICSPSLIIADEPISALDVSLQAQIINLLMDLQDELGVSILLVAHDLAVVRQIADEINIMYLGSVVESAKSADIYKDARHPYTKVLLKAAPSISKGINDVGFDLDMKEGDTPDPANPPKGCPFCTRCTLADKICENVFPPTIEVSEGHFVKCHKAAN